ncbi:MAG: NAD(P) transhydrogenase subunit alpha [Bacteroidota bacterium]
MENILAFIHMHIEMIYIIILSIFVGIEVIGRVPSVLHTPLMSGANAIHGVVIIGSIIVTLNTRPDNFLLLSLGFIAILLGTLNVVGGFVVTDRMLEMFKKKK